MKYLYFVGLYVTLFCDVTKSIAQEVAIKSNLLYDATTSMNLGVEIRLAPKKLLFMNEMTVTNVNYLISAISFCRTINSSG